MQQQKWLFYGQLKQHTIQVLHEISSSEVKIFLNNLCLYHQKIKPQKNKSFSFFVDEELCIVDIVFDNQQYSYNFTSPEYSTSKLSKQKKQNEKKIAAAFALVSILFFGIFLYFVFNFINANKSNISYKKGGLSTIATIIYSQTKLAKTYNSGNKKIQINADTHYSFSVNNNLYYGGINTNNLAGSFSINPNDEFMVFFDPNNPNKHQLMLNMPSNSQINKFKQAARSTCVLQNLNNFNYDTLAVAQYCTCLSYYAYENYGIDGLQNMNAEGLTPLQNKNYNSLTYKAFLKQKTMNEADSICRKK